MNPNQQQLQIECITNGAFVENCYVVSAPGGPDTLVIDPGDEADVILRAVERLGPRKVSIWLTHAHIDHIGAAAAVSRATGAPILVHRAEEAWLGDAELCGATWLGMPFEPCEATQVLDDGAELELLGRKWRVVHVPGHSPGSVLYHSAADDIVFGGDLIFRGSIGRTDLPNGDPREISRSIARAYREIPESARWYVGHGPDTTLADERKGNPYVRMVMR